MIKNHHTIELFYLKLFKAKFKGTLYICRPHSLMEEIVKKLIYEIVKNLLEFISLSSESNLNKVNTFNSLVNYYGFKTGH